MGALGESKAEKRPLLLKNEGRLSGGFNPVTLANSPADSARKVSNPGKGELGSFYLSRGFDEKENESNAAMRN
ncbi:hypothetical protein BC332_09344 [Capsicum chinense]|nr:hypothetical protein BC332_09344 [Capsicum chinense]